MDFENSMITKDIPENKTGSGVPQFRSNDLNEVSLLDLIIVLWRGKYVIIAITIFASITGVVCALIVPESFTSSSTFILKTGKSGASGNLGQLASLAGMPIGNSGGGADPSDYIGQIIQNGTFLATLYDRKWFFSGDSLMLDEILEIEPDTTVSNWQYVHLVQKYESIRKGKIISYSKDGKTGILSLTTNAPDPQLAYDLNKHTLDYIANYIRNTIQGQAKEKRTFIESRLREVNRDLEQSEVALARHKERNFITVSPHVSLETARLTRQVTMNTELYIQLMKQFEAAKVEELDDMTLLQVLRDPEAPIRRSKPQRTMIVMMAFGAGVFVGCFVVFGMNAVKSAVKKQNGTINR